MNRRTLLLLMASATGVAGAGILAVRSSGERAPVRVGVLHSLTGAMAVTEAAVVDATLFAIAELNAAGGILGGRPIVPVVADGASNDAVFVREAQRLIVRERVSAIFGCWTSSARKSVRQVVESQDHLLVYPAGYEGVESSSAIVYVGASPNQKLTPAVTWALDKIGSSIFLVGGDDIFSRTANAVITDHASTLGGVVMGEEYLSPGQLDAAPIVERILATSPSVVLNSLTGDGNRVFFTALRAAGITPETIPIISFALGEVELNAFGPHLAAGDYAAASYFQSIDSAENRAFLHAFQTRYGRERVVGEAMEAAWLGVRLWANAVAQAGTADPRPVRLAIRDQSARAPEGVAYVDPDTQNTWKSVRIGRARGDGQFDIVWTSGKPVRPLPYPLHRSRESWELLQSRLSAQWNGRWSNQRGAEL